MTWKNYLQHNKYGYGDAYAWAYDEAVCAKRSMNKKGDKANPWCQNQENTDMGAVDSNGRVVDSSCPCIVANKVRPLGVVPFRQQGWGKHIWLHVYNVM